MGNYWGKEKTNFELTLDVSTLLGGAIPAGTPDSSATGTIGQFQVDASYLYVATGDDTWMRILGESPY